MNAREYWTKIGFTEASTGGGCVAFHRPIGKDGSHILITSAVNESQLPESTREAVDIGIYDADGHQTASNNAVSSAEAWFWLSKHEYL